MRGDDAQYAYQYDQTYFMYMCSHGIGFLVFLLLDFETKIETKKAKKELYVNFFYKKREWEVIYLGELREFIAAASGYGQCHPHHRYRCSAQSRMNYKNV